MKIGDVIYDAEDEMFVEILEIRESTIIGFSHGELLEKDEHVEADIDSVVKAIKHKSAILLEI